MFSKREFPICVNELLVEAYGCQGPLDDGPQLCDALREGSAAVKATVVKEATHAYCPHGITAVIFLAESHLMVTTWPEHDYAIVEVFFCNPQMDPQKAWEAIARVLQPAQAHTHRVPLRIGPTAREAGLQRGEPPREPKAKKAS